MSLLLLYRPRYESLEYGDGYIPRELPKEKPKQVELRRVLEQELGKKVAELKKIEAIDSALAKEKRNRIQWEIEELLFMVMFLDD